MITPELATILRQGRAEFNARYGEAKRRFPGLSSEVFTAVLTDLVGPLVAAVAAFRPDSATETASVAYDVALELAGQNLAGPAARSPALAEGWRRLLPVAVSQLVEAPRLVLPSLSNALHHLATTPGAAPERWIDDLCRLAPHCRSAAELLTLGQAAAWRAGLAHYRPAALALLDTLPPPLALALLEAPATMDWPAVRSHLAQNCWYDPARGEAEQLPLLAARRVGAFRGFGGLFREPPLVAASGNTLLVRSGDGCWQLTADCYGATFHHAAPALFADASQTALPAGVTINGTVIRRNGSTLALDWLGSFSAVAATPHTLAITSPLSHMIILVSVP